MLNTTIRKKGMETDYFPILLFVDIDRFFFSYIQNIDLYV